MGETGKVDKTGAMRVPYTLYLDADSQRFEEQNLSDYRYRAQGLFTYYPQENDLPGGP